MGEPAVSVIIPTYNRRDELRQTLEALAVQELASAVGRWIERLPCSRPGVGFAHPITRHVERRVSRRHLRDG